MRQLEIITPVQRRKPINWPGRLERLEDGFGKYRCIYADPPWQYQDEKCGGGVGKQYETMPLEKIKKLPVGNLPPIDGGHLWMWTTWPMIRGGEAQQVIAAWGFRWVGEIVWLKPGLGVGRWLRPSTEILILAVNGKVKLKRNNQRGHLHADRSKHSAKPQEFYALVESLSPGPRIELFARNGRENWDRWGNES